MMLRYCTLLLAALSTAACQSGTRSAATTGPSGQEITANPRLLTDFSAPIDKMSLRGVMIGSPRESIRAGRILAEDPNGWIVCRDACRYRVMADKVVTLGVWDTKVLGQLGIDEEADVERVFGKAEEIEKVDMSSTQMTIYRYAGGERRVSWDRMMNKLAAVNLGAAVALPEIKDR